IYFVDIIKKFVSFIIIFNKEISSQVFSDFEDEARAKFFSKRYELAHYETDFYPGLYSDSLF
ncbi:MAG: hypothetical protein ACOC4M_18020, partial [Promethearchaeia archaeon]